MQWPKKSRRILFGIAEVQPILSKDNQKGWYLVRSVSPNLFSLQKFYRTALINYTNTDAEIILKASIFDQVLYEAVKICREIPEADAMAEDTFIDDRNNFRWKDVLSTGLRVFIAGIDGATGVAQVSDGGGTSNDMPWRDKDEDFLNWARRAMRYAHAKHYPGNRYKRAQSR